MFLLFFNYIFDIQSNLDMLMSQKLMILLWNVWILKLSR
jgi:hypothetical protein